jgi:hypothetical protein
MKIQVFLSLSLIELIHLQHFQIVFLCFTYCLPIETYYWREFSRFREKKPRASVLFLLFMF